MKFSWLSNAPWAPTGYGNQTKVFVPRLLAKGHEIAVIAFYGHEGTPITWDGIRVYGRGFLPYGQDIVDAHTRHWGAKLCISLMDAWVVEPEMMVSGIKWVPWFPIDHDPLPPPILNKVSAAHKRIVFSKFGLQVAQEAGLDCYYVPHGVDCEMFKPMDRDEARKELGLSSDRWLVGMVAANKGSPSRKAFFPQLEAFAQFKRRHPDAQIYLHTLKGSHGEGQGVNLVEFIEFLELEHSTFATPDFNRDADVIFCDQYVYMLGFPDEYMRLIYSAMDVHMLVSMGEGFGIPTVEAQACGTPVIVSGWTSSPELCFAGHVVPKVKADPWFTPIASYQWQPRVSGIWSALEDVYTNPPSRKKAREGALEYDADVIVDKYWQPVLADIEGSISNGN